MALRPPDNVSMAARKALRAAVLVHRARESRRVFPPVVHVGVPGGVCADFVVEPDETLDHALRVEVVAALLSRMQARMSRPVVWLTRPGLLEVTPVDQLWLSAARAAYAEAGVALAMVVVTRQGWMDLHTGAGRAWHRLRPRGAGEA